MQVTSEQVLEAEATEDAQLTSAANDNTVPELAASAPTTDAASNAAVQEAEPAPMDTTAAEAVLNAAQVSDHTSVQLYLAPTGS